jgi:hypothetical protein
MKQGTTISQSNAVKASDNVVCGILSPTLPKTKSCISAFRAKVFFLFN